MMRLINVRLALGLGIMILLPNFEKSASSHLESDKGKHFLSVLHRVHRVGRYDLDQG